MKIPKRRLSKDTSAETVFSPTIPQKLEDKDWEDVGIYPLYEIPPIFPDITSAYGSDQLVSEEYTVQNDEEEDSSTKTNTKKKGPKKKYTKEESEERRRTRNRLSARRSREKKFERIAQLEEQIHQLTQQLRLKSIENTLLRNEVEDLSCMLQVSLRAQEILGTTDLPVVIQTSSNTYDTDELN